MASIKSLIARFRGTMAINEEATVPGCGNDLFKRIVCVTGFAFEADDNTQRQVLFKNTTGYDMRLISAEYVPEAAVTADSTNYSTIAIAHQADPAGTMADSSASANTKLVAAGGTGNWVANTAVALTMNTTDYSDNVCEDGEYCVVQLDGTAGTGVDLPIGVWVLTFEVA